MFQLSKLKFKSKTTFGKIRRQFHRPVLPKQKDGSINLHLGCGFIDHPSFINIDALPAPHIHYLSSIDNLTLFEGNSVDLIYACHCLEHFAYEKVLNILFEWFRVLKPGGILRLSVPDFDLILNIYEQCGNDTNFIVGPLMGGQSSHLDYHKAIFNRKTLERLLKQADFKEIREWQPGSCELTTLDDWSSRKFMINGKPYPISLNIEAVK